MYTNLTFLILPFLTLHTSVKPTNGTTQTPFQFLERENPIQSNLHNMRASNYHPLLILLSFFLSAAAGGGGDTRLLLSFKNSLPSPTQLPNWQLTAQPCTFNGVTCTNSRVSSIDLSNHNLDTDFSNVATFLLPLQNLQSLILQNANVSGLLSPSTYCSPSLTTLDLSGNSISGAVSVLRSCVRLNALNLSSNSFTGTVKVTGLNSLSVLDLSRNKLGGNLNLDDLSIDSLVYLDLSSNNFSTNFPLFSYCSSLRHLDLSSNEFVGELGSSLSSCTNLTFLNLTNNHLSGELPTFTSPGLQYLYLKRNHFHGSLPLRLSDSLLELDLSINNLTGNLPECSALVLLDLSNNRFTGELPVDTVLKMSNLRTLVLSFNNFVGSLSGSLSKLEDLEVLDVGSNNLSGLIPANLCPMAKLKVLYLQNNFFTGAIPGSLSNCSELESIDLSLNYLRGTIPSSLGLLSKLKDMIMWLNRLEGEIPREFMQLQMLENLILDFNFLTGGIPPSLSNCTNLNWISLSNNRLSGEIPSSIGRLSKLAILKLGNNSLSGRIPGELGDCQSLIWLDLNTNYLNGTIMPSLFKQSGKIGVALLTGKRFVYIKNNGSKECHGAGSLLEFGGIRDEQLDRVSTCNGRVWRGITQPNFNHNGSMIFLDLSYNNLEGSIPKEIGSMFYLFVLNMGHNALSGNIPSELAGLQNVAILDLSYNRLNGTIPQSLTSLRLGDIDLSNNNLSGTIPESAPLDTFPSYRFENNSGLCGYPLPPCDSSTSRANAQRPRSHRKEASLAGSVAMGLLFSLFCIFGLIILGVEMRKRRKEKEAVLEAYIESNSNSGTAWKISAREALSINVSTFDQRPLRKLTFADLLEATNGFHNDTLIGSGGFGDVYKAELKDGSVVAIKKLIHVSGQGDREFTAEMETIGRIKHRNLVPLLGYCKVGEERLLVYEYMKYGSLEDVLQDRRKIGMRLSWGARRRIAIGAARGLAFLHHNCSPNIIHRDMKSSNVLVDEKLEGRVSDFGMARMMNAMDTHLSVSTLAGTPGYVPPEYYQSFRCSKKGDVYSFGVVLLELITGRKPTDSSDFGDNNLVGWVKQNTKMKISDVFDPELIKDDPGLGVELLRHLKIACVCLDERPSRRPTMLQVLAMFKEIQAGFGIDSASSIDGEFGGVEGIEMTIRE